MGKFFGRGRKRAGLKGTFSRVEALERRELLSVFATTAPTVTAVGGGFSWRYDFSVSTGSQVQSGDSFTIYDFAGFTGAASIPAGWTLDASNANAPDYLFQTRAGKDNPGFTDLKLTYSGAPIGSDSSFISLGAFSFVSSSNRIANSFSEAQDHQIFPAGLESDNHNTQVPAPIAGDLNFDGSVSISDFLTLASNFGKPSALWADGDINGDREVTIADFIDLAAHFGQSISSPAAPAAAEAPASEATASAATSSLVATARNRLPGVQSKLHSHSHHTRRTAMRQALAMALRNGRQFDWSSGCVFTNT